MSADQNKKETEEKFSFIQEQIVPKKRPPIKKFLMSVAMTLILAVLFGVTGSLVFCLSGSFFSDIFNKDNGKKITFATETPTPVPTEVPDKSGDSKDDTDKKDKSDVTIINSSIDATLKDYTKMYSLLSDMAASVNRSILTVSGVIEGEDLFNNPLESTESTYGLVVADNDEELLILTSRSRIADANSIRVTFADGAVIEAALYGYDKELDIAIISVLLKNIPDNTRNTYQTAELGESYTLPLGTPVLALGSPNGYVYSMETGIVTTRSYPRYVTDGRVDLFHTDMGYYTDGEGVIVNLSGEVVGIITHSLKDNKNLNTAMGISRIKPVIEKLVNREERLYLGVKASDITDDYAKRAGVDYGVYVTEVAAKSPAFDAGLLCGDIIMKINDKDITSVTNLNSALDAYKAKDVVKVEVVRTSKEERPKMTFMVELVKKK